MPLNYAKIIWKLQFKNPNPNSELLYIRPGGKWFFHDPKHRKDNDLLNQGINLPIIDIFVCKSDANHAHDNFPIRYSKRKSVDGNILGRRINAETVSYTYQVNITIIWYGTTNAPPKGRPP